MIVKHDQIRKKITYYTTYTVLLIVLLNLKVLPFKLETIKPFKLIQSIKYIICTQFHTNYKYLKYICKSKFTQFNISNELLKLYLIL